MAGFVAEEVDIFGRMSSYKIGFISETLGKTASSKTANWFADSRSRVKFLTWGQGSKACENLLGSQAAGRKQLSWDLGDF